MIPFRSAGACPRVGSPTGRWPCCGVSVEEGPGSVEMNGRNRNIRGWPRVTGNKEEEQLHNLRNMEKRTIDPIRGLMVAMIMALALPAAQAARPGAPPAQATVVLTGWLQTHDLNMTDVVVLVEVGETAQQAKVSESGRFVVELPADSEVLLRFEKPGHVAKEVVVDTRHATGVAGFGKQRKVSFGVVLDLERHMGGLTYAGPVGSMTFDAQGGCLAVDHHRQLVPAKDRRTMVF